MRECVGGGTSTEPVLSLPQYSVQALIRRRDWEYSVTAFVLSDEARNDLRRKVVAEHGEGLKLTDLSVKS